MALDSEPPVFPVSIKLTAARIDAKHTDVAVLGFSNCIVILVTQLSSVGSLVQCVVSQLADTMLADPQHMADQLANEASVPVDIKFLLGNPGACAASSLYQILATFLSQRKHTQNPSDVRPVVLGIGLDLPREYKVSIDDGMPDLGAFSSTMNAVGALVDECRVW
ncbi:hypothetical protein IW139_003157 [Coemansia sp. RSA 353]|nr:hypothetical protein GGH17_005337 [Coemansia sp. RSA 788]KAJ2175462.1 hypothetical protein GGH16_000747 [Coemansia sp. RSA 560]KAJ2191448.1 hypothetical protein EV181_000270 [Coemansia sp. RSA 532]KAJ2205639.1 hypothetical protein IW145_002667 [Coemansia sp. RSA 521]KAJ2223794.1 hypothetical protein IW143_000850 [Coemansia sp. RSA 520]KAJ2226339.1 hypothetical protein GGH97_006638 [Coemansia sp. RSA 475]KAJ2228004.1 hypothetical protein EV180_002200 [Coemansia sp. RSA 518]KAJ2280395.1 hyp